MVGRLVGWWVGWLMTGKSLVSIAPLIGKKFEDIAVVAVASAAGQVTTEVSLKFGISALTNSHTLV